MYRFKRSIYYIELMLSMSREVTHPTEFEVHVH